MGDHEGATGGRKNNMENILIALAMYMKQHKENDGGHKATKVLKGVVEKIGRIWEEHYNVFEVYVCEMVDLKINNL